MFIISRWEESVSQNSISAIHIVTNNIHSIDISEYFYNGSSIYVSPDLSNDSCIVLRSSTVAYTPIEAVYYVT